MAVDDRRIAADGSRLDHPDEEVLAAYAEDRLSSEDRLELERHLSRCRDCRAAVSEATLFLAQNPSVHEYREPRPFRRWPRAVGVMTGLAAAAALVMFVWGRPDQVNPVSTPQLRDLVMAFANEPRRPTEGRLTGGFPYAPAPVASRGSGDVQVSPDVKIAVGRIESAAQASTSAGSLWSLGIARLTMGNVDDAVMALEAALRSDPSNAGMHSDLSAAYLARNRRTGSQSDLMRAQAEADQALALNPGLSEGLFNRALALAALGSSEAKEAWEAYLASETDPRWLKEASTRAASTP